MREKKGFSPLHIIYIAIFSAIMVICSWTSIPSPIPFTLQTMGVVLNLGLLGGKLGTATITATHKELTDSIDIEVKPIDAESIEIVLPDDTEANDNGTPKVNKGSEIQLKAEVLPENTTYKDIEWSVSDETIATIDENGVLTATATGTITITATAKSGVTEEIEIEVYSNAGDTAAGILGLAVIGGGGAAWYYRRKKKKEAEAE